jgi:hypothetical protein
VRRQRNTVLGFHEFCHGHDFDDVRSKRELEEFLLLRRLQAGAASTRVKHMTKADRVGGGRRLGRPIRRPLQHEFLPSWGWQQRPTTSLSDAGFGHLHNFMYCTEYRTALHFTTNAWLYPPDMLTRFHRNQKWHTQHVTLPRHSSDAFCYHILVLGKRTKTGTALTMAD